MTKQSFIKGTMILLAAGIVNRILGFVPRIILPRIIGPEGIGLYQMGYPLLTLILTLITGGIPLAVAKLVAEAEAEHNETRIRSIVKAALAITVSLGLLFTAACLFGAPWITERLFTDDRVMMTFLTMSPVIAIVAVSVVYRGYFQGKQNMIPTAMSQVVETVVRIAAMLTFAWLLLPQGVAYSAAGAMAGVAIGELAAMIVLLVHYRSSRSKRSAPAQVRIRSAKRVGAFANLKEIVKLTAPVTGSKLIGSGSYFFESILIFQCLAVAGVAATTATAQYGALQGMVFPLLLLPTALTYSLSVSLVPSLSEAAARKDMRTIHARLHQSMRLVLITGAPFAMVMFVLAEPLCAFMYNQPQVGGMLKMMAPVAMFIYFQAPLQAALQALDRPGSALINSLAGSVVKLLCIYWLASKPQFGILGAVVAINLNIALVTLLHWHSVVRLLKFKMNVLDFVKVGVAAAIAGVCSYAVMNVSWTDGALVRFLAACAAGMLLYLVLTILFRLVDRSDLFRLLSLGRKLWR